MTQRPLSRFALGVHQGCVATSLYRPRPANLPRPACKRRAGHPGVWAASSSRWPLTLSTRSTGRRDSNSPIAPRVCICSLPAGVVWWMPSARLTKTRRTPAVRRSRRVTSTSPTVNEQCVRYGVTRDPQVRALEHFRRTHQSIGARKTAPARAQSQLIDREQAHFYLSSAVNHCSAARHASRTRNPYGVNRYQRRANPIAPGGSGSVRDAT